MSSLRSYFSTKPGAKAAVAAALSSVMVGSGGGIAEAMTRSPQSVLVTLDKDCERLSGAKGMLADAKAAATAGPGTWSARHLDDLRVTCLSWTGKSIDLVAKVLHEDTTALEAALERALADAPRNGEAPAAAPAP